MRHYANRNLELYERNCSYLAEGPFLVLEEDARLVRVPGRVPPEHVRQRQVLPLVSLHLDQQPDVAVDGAAGERGVSVGNIWGK